MPDMTMLLLVTDKDGNTINDGDIVTDFRGDQATLVRATRARVPGKSGKVLVEWPSDSCGERRCEYYDNVFDLTVSGILSCGCDHMTTWEHGHRDTCQHAKTVQ